MPERITRKWRPPLWFVLGGALAAVLGLPLAGLFALRWMIRGMGFRDSSLIIGVVIVVATAVDTPCSTGLRITF